MTDLAVETRDLTKAFGRHTAVDGVHLEVPRGAVYGFLGPNGSGKTTTIRMLLGLARPTRGSRSVLGRDVATGARDVLARVGVMVEGPAFHPHLSGRRNLERLDACDATADPATSRARIDAALERVGLTPAGGKRFRAYSLGMKQRLALAATLLRPRDLLVLDEPTNGLDPQGTREVRGLVASLAREGATVLVSSHLLAEIEQMCTHVGVMSAGRLVAQGTLADLEASRESRFHLRTPDPARAARVLEGLRLGEVRVDGDVVEAGARESAGLASTAPANTAPEDVVAALVAAGVRVREFGLRRRTLEDVYVELTGEGFEVRG